jgi:hypothetical protein
MRSGLYFILFVWLSPSGWEACEKEDAHGAPKGDIGLLVSDNMIMTIVIPPLKNTQTSKMPPIYNRTSTRCRRKESVHIRDFEGL